MNILIVSTYFPPENSIASMRSYTWAKYWSRAGHDVEVVTTRKPDLASNCPCPTDGFVVREIPVPCIDLVCSVAGGASTPTSMEGTSATGMFFGKKCIRRCIDRIKDSYGCFNTCRFPDLHDLWSMQVINSLGEKKWDVVVSSAGPYSVHWVGYFLKKRNQTKKWIADWRDLWSQNHLYSGFPLFRKFEKFWDKKFNSIADMVTTVSEPLAQQLRCHNGSNVCVIYNGYDTEEYAQLDEESIFNSNDRTFRILYTGTIYVGKQDPTPLLMAIKKLYDNGQIVPTQLMLITIGANSDLRKMALRLGIADFVEYGGFVPRNDSLRMQRDANVLLFLDTLSDNSGILTGKLFEYLFSGTPIIALGATPSSEAAKLIQSGSGEYLGSDVEKICKWLVGAVSGTFFKKKTMTDNSQFSLYSRCFQAHRLLDLILSL